MKSAIMGRFWAVSVSLVLLTPVVAEDWRSIPEDSVLRFSSAYDGDAFSGAFEQFRVRMNFDPDQPDTAELRVEVDTGSVNTGSADRDDILRGGDWFATANYPSAIFQASQLTAGHQRAYRLSGDLSIKGTTCPAAVEFDWSMDNEKLTISGSALMTGETVVTRTEYGLGTGDWADTSIIEADVPVSFEVVLRIAEE